MTFWSETIFVSLVSKKETLQHIATHCNPLVRKITVTYQIETMFVQYSLVAERGGKKLQRTATHCNSLQLTRVGKITVSSLNETMSVKPRFGKRRHCDTLQHTATHCNTLVSERGDTATLYKPLVSENHRDFPKGAYI